MKYCEKKAILLMNIKLYELEEDIRRPEYKYCSEIFLSVFPILSFLQLPGPCGMRSKHSLSLN